MDMTEDEARTKWCPFARLAFATSTGETNVPGYNRVVVFGEEPTLNPEDSRCIGSDCMAWRWVMDPDEHGVCPPPTRGHCGLA